MILKLIGGQKQKGSAIIWILIAVALFAALGYAFSQNSRTSTSMITDEQRAAYAREMIAYGDEIKAAVKRLKLRGCSDAELSFDSAYATNWACCNPTSPTDNRCHVFEEAGGGLRWKEIPSEVLNQADSGQGSFGDWAVSRNTFVNGVGTDCANTACVDLTAVWPHLTKEMCLKINEILDFPLNGTDPITDPDKVHFFGYTDTFVYNSDGGVEGPGGEINGQRKGCVSASHDPGGSSYLYYHVLLPR